MTDDAFNMSLRKFLKRVGVTSQSEIEAAVRAGLASGHIKPGDKVKARAVLTIDGLDLDHAVEGEIEVGDA